LDESEMERLDQGEDESESEEQSQFYSLLNAWSLYDVREPGGPQVMVIVGPFQVVLGVQEVCEKESDTCPDPLDRRQVVHIWFVLNSTRLLPKNRSQWIPRDGEPV